MVPVGIVGADGRKALEVAAVSLIAKGTELLRPPWHTSLRVEGCSDTPPDVIVVVAFALSVVHAVFVDVASGEIKMHLFGSLTGQEERFGRTWGWI
jgi:hypothetical protein